jgi:hypothetical protein
MKEKLIITCEIDNIDNFVEDIDILQLQIITINKGFLSRIFKNWRKITYKPAIIKEMKTEKIIN